MAAIVYSRPVPPAEIERFAKALCGRDDDPGLFTQAVIVAKNEWMLRIIRDQQVAMVERLREFSAVAHANQDSGLALAEARAAQAEVAYDEIVTLLPRVVEKYRDQLPDLKVEIRNGTVMCEGDIVPILLKSLLRGPETTEQQRDAMDWASKQIEERDEYEALEAAARDLIRLDRYERRAWSRQKRAIRSFINLKLMRALDDAANRPPEPPNPSDLVAVSSLREKLYP